MIRFILVLGAVSVVLLVWSVFDISLSARGAIRRFPRALWLLIALLPILGPVCWIRYGRPVRAGGSPLDALRQMKPRRRGPIAPDDDPDFLRKL